MGAIAHASQLQLTILQVRSSHQTENLYPKSCKASSRDLFPHSMSMAAIGTLVFCTACGNLLDASSGNAKAILTCNQCGTENQGKRMPLPFLPLPPLPLSSTLLSFPPSQPANHPHLDIPFKTITTKSKPNAFPSLLRSKLSSVQSLSAEDVETHAVIQETCPDCGRTEMRWYTQQLRGADEGSTVFYECECGHK